MFPLPDYIDNLKLGRLNMFWYGLLDVSIKSLKHLSVDQAITVA